MGFYDTQILQIFFISKHYIIKYCEFIRIFAIVYLSMREWEFNQKPGFCRNIENERINNEQNEVTSVSCYRQFYFLDH